MDPEDETVDQLARLYDRHDQRTTRVQRLANRVTATLGLPLSLVVISGLAIAWIVGNYAARLLGSPALEQFPFPHLEFISTVSALLVALLILTTQRHGEELAESRAQLTLHIAMMSERKIAKVIALLEEQRRDNPMLPSRTDAEAIDMATPSDHDSALGRIAEVTDNRP
ncbi:DUF1003 domain-containing protein [Sphingomonas bacterium]|uniref:DUF1003 domain-containing protein n=1 Tax=Sphingomonas bacterium TaxID=1895847 RepID=UPI001575841F|nr:DUF1003 domain-containing protein [Sphingomonas bacterium]